MLSTSALTWAAAQEHVPVYELIRGLSVTDERRIEAAYSEWRRRAAAGERRHKVDWRNYSLSDDEVVVETAETGAAVEPEKAKPAAAVEPSAKDVASVPVPDEPVPADPVPAVEAKPVPDDPILALETNEAEEATSDPVSTVETSETEETVSDEPVRADPVPAVETNEAEEAAFDPVLDEDVPDVEESEAKESVSEEPFHTMEQREADRDEAGQAAIEALTEILEEEQLDGDYISLDDFNLEPSEAEMQALEEAIKEDELLTEDVGEDAADAGEATDAGETADDDASQAEAVVAEAREAAITELIAAVDETVKLRISRLRKDVPTSVFEDLLVSFASNIEVAKAVTEAVIKDHTKRHKGTAPQRAFLAWLENR